jgi:hypothetical protein
MNTITLTDSEIFFCNEIARKRIEFNQQTNTCNTPYKDSLEKVMQTGMYGEVGFCKLYNIFPSFEFDSYDGCGFDAWLHGRRVEVKTNSRADGWLGIKDIPKIDTPPDYFALMITANLPILGFAGFISSSSVLNPWHYVKESKKIYHPLYVAYQNELIPELPVATTEGWGNDDFDIYIAAQGEIPTN